MTRIAIKDFKAALAFPTSGAAGVAFGVTNLPTIQAAKTISVWIKPYSQTFGDTIWSYELFGSKQVGLSFGAGGNSLLVGAWGGVTLLNVAISKMNEWKHVTYTFDGTNHVLYINGSQIGTSTNVGDPGTPTAFYLGAYSGTNSPFRGKFSTPQIWNTNLSAAQIQTVFFNNLIPTGNVLNAKLNEGAGTTAVDTSGNSNNGTITGASYTADVPMVARKLVNGNLVKNGDFEFAPPFTAATATGARFIDGTAAGSTSNNLFGWYISGIVGSASAKFDNTVSYSSTNSLKVSITATGSYIEVFLPTETGAGAGYYGKIIPVLPNTSYTLTYRMKTNYVSGDATNGAAVVLIGSTGAGTDATSSVSGTYVKTTTDWTQYTLTLTTAATVRYLQINPRVYGHQGTGTLIMDAWFDDISLKPTTSTTRAAA